MALVEENALVATIYLGVAYLLGRFFLPFFKVADADNEVARALFGDNEAQRLLKR